MSTLVSEALAKKVRFDGDTMWVDLEDGRTLGVPLAYFPRLLNASPSQRKKYIISGGGSGNESHNVFSLRGSEKHGVCYMTLTRDREDRWWVETCTLNVEGVDYRIPVRKALRQFKIW